MKSFSKSLLLVIFNLITTTFIFAQTTQTIQIDFGNVITAETGWNNVTNPNAGTTVNLINSSGITTGLVLTVTDAFAGINNNGAAAVPALNIPITGSGDSFYGNTGTYSGKIETSGEVEISNLDPVVSYTFTIFSSRSGVTDNRETNYTVIGATTSSLQLNVSNNTANTVTFNDIVPANDGTIRIKAEKGINNSSAYGFFYLGYINMTYQKNEEPANKSVTLIYPNGGQALKFGQQAYVIWESTNITYLNLDYSLNNGSTWYPIASSVSTSAGYHIWTVPYVLTKTCLVRVTDASDNSISDVSDATSSIISNRKDSSDVFSVTVLSPNGGEEYMFDDIITIDWISTNVSNVDLDYSTDNGTNWNSIATSVLAIDGTYNWTIPSIASDNCLVRVTDISNNSLFDLSNSTFKIISNVIDSSMYVSKTIQVDFGDPNNQTTANGWNNVVNPIGNTIIDLVNSDGGQTGLTIQITDVFNWYNPIGTLSPESSLNIPSSGSGDSFFGNTSTFGGKTEPTGEIQFSNLDITTRYSFTIFASRIDVSDNREAKYTITGSTTLSGNLDATNNTSEVVNFYNILPASDGTIKIKAEPGDNNDNPTGFYYLGVVKVNYKEIQDLTPTISLISPNGGETLYAEVESNITWTSANITTLNIDYSIDNGLNWSVVATTIDASSGFYAWNVPSSVSDQCLVRISDASNSALSDISDGVFSISNDPTIITELVQIDFGNNITTANGWNNVVNPISGTIYDLVNSDGVPTGLIIQVTDDFSGTNPNGGEAVDSLNIPTTASGDSFYGNYFDDGGPLEPTGEVEISNLDPSLFYTFTIFSSRSDVADNRQTMYTITGNISVSGYLNASNNTSNVVIFNNISPESDGTIRLKAENGPNNDNSYRYYYLGVVKFSTTKTTDPNFKSLTLSSPNGGENYGTGNQTQITWYSVNVTSIDIDYSLDNGVNWVPIVTSQPASAGSYDWTLPTSTSDNCLVRITDVSDVTITDQSNAVFRIVPGDQLFHVVVLGSSTAAGFGPSSFDSAWVWRYQEYLQSISTGYTVTNLAVGGFTTEDILPLPYGNQYHNITMALSLNPDAIIINLPSNDTDEGIPVAEQLVNYQTVVTLANNAGVPVWIATPQPRDFGSNATKYQMQFDMLDSVLSIYGEFALDFWTPVATPGGLIMSQYNSGDGVHLNDAGHYLYYLEVIGKNIQNYIFTAPSSILSTSSNIVTTKSIAKAFKKSQKVAKNSAKLKTNDNSIDMEIFSNIKVFPNPTVNEVNINVNNGSVIQSVSIYNTGGKKLVERDLNSNNGVVNVSELSTGLYFMVFKIDNKNYNYKIIKK